MCCPHCGNESVQRFGKDRSGEQRRRCKACKRTFTSDQPRVLGAMRLPVAQAIECLRLLMEGMSIRSCERITGVNRNTICDLILTVGERCRDFLNKRLQAIPVTEVEIDETWSYVAMRERTKLIRNREAEYEIGDCYAYIALERNTKLIVGYMMGKRDADDTYDFCAMLKNCVAGRFQVSTDGWGAYATGLPFEFGRRIDYARIIKVFENPSPQKGGRYCPAKIVRVDKKPMLGDPDPKRICTSHVERSNLTVRMTLRRWGRFTNAFSKTWRHHSAAFAIYVAFYNFCRPHLTLKTTPAVASRLTDHRWTWEELLTTMAA